MNVDNRIEDGWIVMGDSPGLGITVDEEKLETCTTDIDPGEAGAMFRGRRRGAGLYLVGLDEAEDVDE